jgi:hypothetical protein
MSDVRVLPAFASADECAALVAWALGAVEDGQFVDAITQNPTGEVVRVTTRRTNRMSTRIEYPRLVYEMRERIARALDLTGYGPIEGHGRDGAVCSITYDGGDVYEHVDPGVGPGFHGLRCNLLAGAPESGGAIWIAGQKYEFRAGDLHCYLVTKHRHRVETCHGPVPRVLFMFGWRVPARLEAHTPPGVPAGAWWS